MNDQIVIRGAKEHNLKNIDLTIPRNKMIVFTGLSGSGKSSLAFDTIYAEGQRRYVESLSSYARQFLGQMEKPNVDYIEGLSPAISIDQKTTSKNPRSTVGTVTEIYDYLRLLYANIGIPHCIHCGKTIEQMSVQEIVDKIMEIGNAKRIQIIAPVVRGKKGRHEKVLEAIKNEGYIRLRIDGENYEIGDDINLDKNKKHDIDVIVDRIVIKDSIESRLNDSIETALKLTEGLVTVNIIDGEEMLFSTKFACPEHGITLEEISPRVFSFNAPYGACPECNGLGMNKNVDAALVVPDENLSLRENAVEAWASSDKNENTIYFSMIKALADSNGVSMDVPYRELPEDFKKKLLYGSDDKLKFNYESRFSDGYRVYESTFEGVINNLERRYKETPSEYIRTKIENYMIESPCRACNGKRLKPEVLAVTLGGRNITQVTELSVGEHIKLLSSLNLSKNEEIIAGEIIKEINQRLNFLKDVGLDYLTLARQSGTLSGGESQRIRLATQIGSALVGVLYVLDEPSIGLHQKDNERLLKTLRDLTDIGNTLIVVEHDEDTMYAADQIVDIGPGAGIHGGEIVCQGTAEEIMECDRSLTGKYLSGKLKIETP